MKNSGIDKKYYAIDTFSGFVKEDIEYEQGNRAKTNNYRSFRKNKNNGLMARCNKMASTMSSLLRPI
jgi:hypothetical protein